MYSVYLHVISHFKDTVCGQDSQLNKLTLHKIEADDLLTLKNVPLENKFINKKSNNMFQKPFSFEGRIRRTEFGISYIIFAIAMAIVNSIGSAGESAAIIFIAYIPLYWFLFAQGAKREHDLDFSGWWQLIPFRYLWLTFLKGQIGPNRFGQDPKETISNV